MDDVRIEELLVKQQVNTWPSGDMRAFRTKITAIGKILSTNTLGPLNVYACNAGGAGKRRISGSKASNLWVISRHAYPKTYSFTSADQKAFVSFLTSNAGIIVAYHSVKSWAQHDEDGVCRMPQWKEFLVECSKTFPNIFTPDRSAGVVSLNSPCAITTGCSIVYIVAD
eukprot:SAG11_NODE_3013_length_2764_cov_4.581614_2_plen_169_part_00